MAEPRKPVVAADDQADGDDARRLAAGGDVRHHVAVGGAGPPCADGVLDRGGRVGTERDQPCALLRHERESQRRQVVVERVVVRCPGADHLVGRPPVAVGILPRHLDQLERERRLGLQPRPLDGGGDTRAAVPADSDPDRVLPGAAIDHVRHAARQPGDGRGPGQDDAWQLAIGDQRPQPGELRGRLGHGAYHRADDRGPSSARDPAAGLARARRAAAAHGRPRRGARAAPPRRRLRDRWSCRAASIRRSSATHGARPRVGRDRRGRRPRRRRARAGRPRRRGGDRPVRRLSRLPARRHQRLRHLRRGRVHARRCGVRPDRGARAARPPARGRRDAARRRARRAHRSGPAGTDEDRAAAGRRGLVLGDGTIALLVAHLAGLWSPARIVVRGLREQQRRLASAVGAGAFATRSRRTTSTS